MWALLIIINDGGLCELSFYVNISIVRQKMEPAIGVFDSF